METRISLSERAGKAYSENAGEAVTLDKSENVIETDTVKEATSHPSMVIIPSLSLKEHCENCRDVIPPDYYQCSITPEKIQILDKDKKKIKKKCG